MLYGTSIDAGIDTINTFNKSINIYLHQIFLIL